MRISSSSKLLGSLMTMTTSTPLKSPAVRFHSLNSVEVARKNLRVLHIVRHAQGYHNVNQDYKNEKFKDAELTEYGIQQCKELSQRLKDENLHVECIISSPMRRALQTAYYSFEHVWKNEKNIDQLEDVPFVACENWRETVNYVCDVRYPRSRLKNDFPYVNFDNIEHEEDPIWNYYEAKYGSLEEYTKHRESGDDEGLAKRARLAWSTIAERPENSLAVVSHSAFFMHMFTRPELGIVSYEDHEVETLMTTGFENCEIRSVAFEICDNV